MYFMISGKEFDYIVLSTVRTVTSSCIERYPDAAWKKDKLGQLTDRGLITTVLTRARKGLIIIGELGFKLIFNLFFIFLDLIFIFLF